MNLSISTTVQPLPRYAPVLAREFSIAVRAAILARSKGREVEHYHQAKVAEDVLTAALPQLAQGIRRVAARKGKSQLHGSLISAQLDGPTAAAVTTLWSIRNARFAGIVAILKRRARHAGFGATLTRLLGHDETKRLLRRVKWSGTLSA